MKQAITTGPGLPASSGAYSPAVVVGDLCFLSGQSPVDPQTGELVPGDVSAQAHRTLDNVFAVLAAAGFGVADLAYVHVVLTDIADWDAVNAVYRERLGGTTLPARMIVGGGQVLPAGARIEIQATAARG